MGEVMGRMPNHVTKEFIENNVNLKRTAKFKKKVDTPAIRMSGPFSVDTREGSITCEDGWLAIDAGGWPYPIADDEFRRIYDPVDEEARVYLEAMP